MKKTNIFIKGIAIGAGMSIPGISGGTMAIILGIYNELLWRMGNIFKDPKKNIGFLCVFTLGGLGGIISSSGIISFILSTSAGVPLRFAFLGAAMGCIPPILRAAEIRPLTPKKILCILVGMTAATMLTQHRSLHRQSQLSQRKHLLHSPHSSRRLQHRQTSFGQCG